MVTTANEQVVVNAGGGWFYMDRILGNDGAAITQATLSSITRSITDTTTGTVVTDSLTIGDVVFDSLQTIDARWTNAGGSSTGYNFLDAVPASKIPKRRKYLLQYTFTPASGQIFKTKEIDVEGD